MTTSIYILFYGNIRCCLKSPAVLSEDKCVQPIPCFQTLGCSSSQMFTADVQLNAGREGGGGNGESQLSTILPLFSP